jgi:hypothetical protein
VTVQNVILISCEVNEIFMGVYLAIACLSRFGVSPTPNEGRPNGLRQGPTRPFLQVSGGLPLMDFRG